MPPNPMNLRQKLNNLSLAASAPSGPSNGSFSSWPLRVNKGKQLLNKFAPPWANRPESPIRHEYSDWEKVQNVMPKLIFQAGVDFETRPMVVITASALPDPDDVNYDLLLSRILSYLNLYVESDYTVVFFAANAGHTPGWNWVWKAYRSLSRKYRKNLKQLYIVHTSFFTKMLFSLAGAIISPKFFRKIIHISTLSELAQYVPLTQIDIPPAVYQENAKYENEIILPVPTRSSIFGVPLEELMGYNGEKGGIPRVVKDSIQFLRESGLEHEGLFRRSPSSAMLRAAKDAYDRGNVVSLETFGDPFLAAVLIKKYLRDLPEPIFPEQLYPVINRCPLPTNDPTDMTAVNYIRDILLLELVPCAYILLSNILHLMHEVALRSNINKMDAYNLTIVLCPNLVKGANPIRDVMMCSLPGSGPSILDSNVPTSNSNSHPFSGGSVNGGGHTTLGMIIKLCIQRYFEVFDEVVDRSEVVSPSRIRTLHSNVEVEHQPQPQQHSTFSSSFHHFQQLQHSNSNSNSNLNPSPNSNPNPNHIPRPILPTHVTAHEDEEDEDEDDIDDTMLVMNVEPGIGPGKHRSNTSMQWAKGVSSSSLSRTGLPPPLPPKPNFHLNSTSASTPRSQFQFQSQSQSQSSPQQSSPQTQPQRPIHSIHTNTSTAGSAGYPYPSMSKAKSVFSIENGSGTGNGTGTASGNGNGGRKGTISIGRGTMKKSIGSGVEAMGVTAEGFFAAPVTSSPSSLPLHSTEPDTDMGVDVSVGVGVGVGVGGKGSGNWRRDKDGVLDLS